MHLLSAQDETQESSNEGKHHLRYYQVIWTNIQSFALKEDLACTNWSGVFDFHTKLVVQVWKLLAELDIK